MDVLGVTPHPFRMTARVPDDMVSLDTDGEWAAWSGFDCVTGGERKSVIDELAAADGNPALRIRCTVTEQRGGRSVTTGQAQAFVLFPGADALGVVSAVCPDPADLDRACVLVAGIAARMAVTAATAAA